MGAEVLELEKTDFDRLMFKVKVFWKSVRTKS